MPDPLAVVVEALEASRGRDIEDQAQVVLVALWARGFDLIPAIVWETTPS